MKYIYYTFRTNPFLKELSYLFGEIFVFNKLNIDFKKFKKKIIKEKPDLIVGLAKTPKNFSYFDLNCFNQFGKNKRIIKNGEKKYNLFIIKNIDFRIIDNLTTKKSFCNWTMYKIINFIKEENLKTKLMFTHIKKDDLEKLETTLKIRH